MEEENILLLVCVHVFVCACVSLPYQSVSAVLICQKIFPLMCLGMKKKKMGGGSFHLASELLRKHLSINISRHGEGSGAGRWFDHTQAGTHRGRSRNH